MLDEMTSSEMLQNLPYFWNTNIMFCSGNCFLFSFGATFLCVNSSNINLYFMNSVFLNNILCMLVPTANIPEMLQNYPTQIANANYIYFNRSVRV